MALTCGKDNLLRCVDVRRFEASAASWRAERAAALLLTSQLAGCESQSQGGLAMGLVPLQQGLGYPLPQVLHTLSAPSFSVGGAWAAACLRCVEHLRSRRCSCCCASLECRLPPPERPPPPLRTPRSPTEQQAVAGGGDGTVFVWELPKGSVKARLRDPKQHQPVVACAWCPLGLPLVSCDKAGGLSFWSATPRKRGA